jgi:hypothetical protein
MTNNKIKMKKFISLFFSIIFIVGCDAPQVNKQGDKSASTNTAIKYDSLLARQLGADAYGMKQYVMAFLKRGPNRDHDSATAAELIWIIFSGWRMKENLFWPALSLIRVKSEEFMFSMCHQLRRLPN